MSSSGACRFGEMPLCGDSSTNFDPADEKWHTWLDLAPSAWVEDQKNVALLDRGTAAVVRPPALRAEVCMDAIECAANVGRHVRLALDQCKRDGSTRAATVAAIARGCGLHVDEEGSKVRALVAKEPVRRRREAVDSLDLGEFSMWDHSVND